MLSRLLESVPVRRRMVLLLFAVNMVCYMVRTNISVALVPISQTYGFSAMEEGWILAAFYYGYICTQIPGAHLTARYGGCTVLLVAVFSWSLFTLLTPPLSSISLSALVLCRLLLGLSEGVTMPAVHHLVAQWVPAQERSLSVTFASSGQFVGMVVALLCSPLAAHDWPTLFYLFGALGFGWCLLCWSYGASSPETHPHIARSEREFVIKHRARDTHLEPVLASASESAAECKVTLDPRSTTAQSGNTSVCSSLRQHTEQSLRWTDCFAEPAFIAVVVAHVCHNYGFYLLLSWLPKYFEGRWKTDVASAGIFSLAPYLLMFVCSNLGGYLSDWLISTGRLDRVSCRKTMQAVAFLVPCIFLWLVRFASTLTHAQLLLTLSIGFSSFSHSGYWVNLVDLGPRHSARLMSFSNTVATVPGIVGNLVTGYLLQGTGDWDTVFLLASCLYLVGFVVFSSLARAHIVFP